MDCISEFGATQVAVVEDDYCYDNQCCTRYINMTVYGEENYSNFNVTFLLNKPKPYVYNPDGSVSVFGVEIRSNPTFIASVRNVVWIWGPVQSCGQKNCEMELVQYRSVAFNCLDDAPPCGDCSVCTPEPMADAAMNLTSEITSYIVPYNPDALFAMASNTTPVTDNMYNLFGSPPACCRAGY